jgi:pimeloyl-ACP methyl ester carboxylesterase
VAPWPKNPRPRSTLPKGQIRASAHQLKAFIDRQLPRWREYSGAKDARVILIAHSMGGLVSRYYLEMLEGWKSCRTLMTVGTPHRGALNAVETLACGLTIYPALNGVVRQLTSIYQLLPIYEAVLVDGVPTRVGETDALPFIERERAKAAREELHLAIVNQARANRTGGLAQLTIPWVGVYQDTVQSALVDQGHLTMSYAPPPIVDAAYAGGDGTVPRVSAVPADFTKEDEDRLPRYSAQQHGWLTNNPMTLTPLVETLRGIIAPGAQPVLGGVEQGRPAIRLRAASAFDSHDPVTLHLALGQAAGPLTLEARLEPVEPGAATLTAQTRVAPDEVVDLQFAGVSPGLYRVTVRSRGGLANPPDPVQSLVEVIDAAELDAVNSIA